MRRRICRRSTDRVRLLGADAGDHRNPRPLLDRGRSCAAGTRRGHAAGSGSRATTHDARRTACHRRDQLADRLRADAAVLRSTRLYQNRDDPRVLRAPGRSCDLYEGSDVTETWQELLRKKSIASLEALAARFGPEHVGGGDIARLRQAAENFEFRISPAMVDLIQSPGDPIWKQYVPTVQELEVHDGLVDSLEEDANSPVPNITHRYPDRALFLVSPVCASYCRFCTRRRKVGDPEKIPMSQFESAFQYLEAHREIRDVIMSGGDPLMLSDRRLEAILSRLRSIQHIEIIRIGSRVPCHLPPSVETGLKIMKALRGWTSGLANPHFVIDAPGGGGKVPLLPEYVESFSEDEVILRNFRGERYVYRQPRGVGTAGPRKFVPD